MTEKKMWDFFYPQRRSIRSQIFFKLGVLKNLGNFTRKHLSWSLFLIKRLQLYEKETPAQVFSCEITEIFKNTFFYGTPQVAASDNVIETVKNNFFFTTLVYFLKNGKLLLWVKRKFGSNYNPAGMRCL